MAQKVCRPSSPIRPASFAILPYLPVYWKAEDRFFYNAGPPFYHAFQPPFIHGPGNRLRLRSCHVRFPLLAEPGKEKPDSATVRGISHAAALAGKHPGTTEGPA